VSIGLGGTLVTTRLASNCPTMRKPHLTPADRRSHADTETRCDGSATHAALHRSNHSIPQILR
jgi:hypothetical protein